MATVLHLIQNRPLRWICAIIWTAFISILLVQPEGDPLIYTGIPPAPPTLERELLFTSAHLIAFGVTCAVWFWAWFGHLRLTTSLLMGIVFAIAIGSITEYLQTYSPDRHPSIIDFLANCIGTLTIAYFIWKKQSDVMRWNKTIKNI